MVLQCGGWVEHLALIGNDLSTGRDVPEIGDFDLNAFDCRFARKPLNSPVWAVFDADVFEVEIEGALPASAQKVVAAWRAVAVEIAKIKAVRVARHQRDAGG